jgi:glycosyltransferase involved in cell wall biosynthesis
MKSLLVINPNSGIGGATKSLLDLVEMLKNKYQLTVLLNKKDDFLVNQLKFLKINIIFSPFLIPNFSIYKGGNSLFGFSSFKNMLNLIFNKKIKEFFSSLQFDEVIFNSIVLTPIVRFFRKNVIVYNRENISNIFSILFFSYYLLKYKSKVIFLAKSQKNHFSFIKNNIVISDVIKLHDQKNKVSYRIPKKEELFTIIFLGGFDFLKGLNNLLNATKYLDPFIFRLIILGDTNIHKLKETRTPFWHLEKKAFIKTILNFNNSFNNVKFLGEIKDPSKFYRISNLVVFPSNVAHQSRPGIEAGYYKIPFIISDFYETSEYFQNNFNCLTFKPKSSIDLAKKIISLYLNKNLGRTLVENNSKMNNIYHNFEKNSYDLINFIN